MQAGRSPHRPVAPRKTEMFNKSFNMRTKTLHWLLIVVAQRIVLMKVCALPDAASIWCFSNAPLPCEPFSVCLFCRPAVAAVRELLQPRRDYQPRSPLIDGASGPRRAT